MIVAAYVTIFSVSLGTIRGLKSTPPAPRAHAHDRREPLGDVSQGADPGGAAVVLRGAQGGGALAVIGEIVVELAGSKDGLGTLLLTTQYYGPQLRLPVLGGPLVTMLLGSSSRPRPRLLERVVAPWQPELRKR